MIRYGVREVNFIYDDNFSYHPIQSDGNIIAKYDDYESALQDIKRLELNSMRQHEPALFFFLHGYERYDLTKEKMTLFFQEEFKVKIDNWRAEQYYLPDNATDNQVAKCKNILQVNFFRVAELPIQDSYYKPIVNPIFWDAIRYETAKDEMFEIEWKGYTYFTSIDEAVVSTPSFLRYWMFEHNDNSNTPGFIGTLEDLSSTPQELASFLKGSQDFEYDYSENKIKLKSTDGLDPDINELGILIMLLKEKPYTFQAITFEEAKKLEYWFRNADGTFWYPDSHQ